MTYIGLDPDVEKTGVGIAVNGRITELHNLPFWELIDFLSGKTDITVVIEASWLNKTASYHSAKNVGIAAKIGGYVAANHQVGKLLVEFCVSRKIPHLLSKPTKSKVDHPAFCRLTGWTKRTNSEQRDAAMLVLGRK